MSQMRLKAFVQSDVDDVDFVLCEIGGTVGDIEALPFSRPFAS